MLGETIKRDKLNPIVKVLVAYNYINIVYIFLRIYTLVASGYDLTSFYKRNIIGLIIITILNFVFSKKLKRQGYTRTAKTLLVFGILSILIVCFYIFMLSVPLLYPGYQE